MTLINFITKCEEFAQRNFSLANLRPAQREVLQLIFEKNFVLATLPTGAGKTLLYSLPALFFEERPVLVISPLISLMRDQERRMKLAKIPCVIFTSEQSEEERKYAWQMLHSKETKIIFASPERVVLPSFLNAMIKINLGMAVVDEAHCVVSWGHHFRPEYSEIGKVLSKISPPRILAITATASRNSRQDIIKRVFPENTGVFEYISHPIAKNITISSMRVFSKVQQWDELIKIIKKSDSEKSLIYFSTRSQCEEATFKLKKLKIHAVTYHAGLSKTERKNVEQYAHDTTQKTVICATSAFGMGVDISGICLVVVYGFPSNIEEFFQMLGRAGRGGEPARGMLLWCGSDPIRRDYQFKESFPDSSQFLKQCASFSQFMPKEFSESTFVEKGVLLDALKSKETGKETNKERRLENILAGMRICNVLEDVQRGESYLHLKLAPSVSFAAVLAELPQDMTKRKKVLEGFVTLVDKKWLSLRGAQAVVSLKMLTDASQMTLQICSQVFFHYQEKKIFLFAKIVQDETRQGVILKNGYAYMQKELPRYISARSHSQASLRELHKLSVATVCRLLSSFDFFAIRSIQGAGKKNSQCMQCDLCLKKEVIF